MKNTTEIIEQLCNLLGVDPNNPSEVGGIEGLLALAKEKLAPQEEDDEQDPAFVETITALPYEGKKRIVLLSYSARGSSTLDDDEVTFVDSGYYDLGDAGSDSTIYIGEFTHKQLCKYISTHPTILDVFEVDGWNYDEDAFIVSNVMEESGEAIRLYLSE